MLTQKDGWLIQDGTLNADTLPIGAYFFMEYGTADSDPLADKSVWVFNILAATFDFTESILKADGTYELLSEDQGVSKASGLNSLLRGIPIYSDMTEFDPADWLEVQAQIGGTV